jgi:hypothetical protein
VLFLAAAPSWARSPFADDVSFDRLSGVAYPGDGTGPRIGFTFEIRRDNRAGDVEIGGSYRFEGGEMCRFSGSGPFVFSRILFPALAGSYRCTTAGGAELERGKFSVIRRSRQSSSR